MLQTLQLQHVRSYENELFEFKPGVNIIVGPNASGKTNLLESISMLYLGSAFKSTDEHMVAVVVFAA
jgi:DNA replication and repair protein RecF